MKIKPVHAAITLLFLCGALAAQAASAATCPTLNVMPVSPVSSAADFNNIQNAINTAAALSGGGTVVLSAGTFQIDSATPISLKANVALCSTSGAIVKYARSPANVVVAAGDYYANVSADNAQIANITFDNGIVLLHGDTIAVTGNTFQNIPQDNGTWGALGMDRATHVTISGNKFKDLVNGGITGFDIANVLITGNSFSNVWQGVSVHNDHIPTTSIAVTGNTMDKLTRMGIEIMGLHGRNVSVENNRLTNWNYQNLTPTVDLIGLSIVSGDSASIKNNTLICGAGCARTPVASHFPDNRDCDESVLVGQTPTWMNQKGWGLEIAGIGSTAVSGNTVQGFAVGVVIGTPTETISVNNNAIYNAVHGIDKAEGPTTVTSKIENNYIDNARSTGVTGTWNVAANTVIKGNLITRQPGIWAADGTCAFNGIVSSAAPSGSSPMVIDGNRILFEGAPLSGFTARGVVLAGWQGDLSGTDIKNNWIGNSYSSAYGSGLYLNAPGSSTGVKLTNNTLQNLTAATTGVSESYYASPTTGNLAINMPGTAVFVAQPNTFLPSVSINPGSASGTGPMTVTWSEPTAWTFANAPTWYLGDGATATGGSTTRTYPLAAKRTVRVVQPSTSRVMSIGTATITQQ